MTDPKLSLEQEIATATDGGRDHLLELLKRVPDGERLILPPSNWPTKPRVRRINLFKVFWRVTDEQTGDTLASGYRPTARWALHAQDQAAARIHDQRTGGK